MADKKSTTIRDLQTFIDAVEFASDQEEWVPSARQWKRIRDMINSLEETKTAPVPASAPVQFQQPVQFPHPPQFAGIPQMGMPTTTALQPAQIPNNPLLAQHEKMPVKTPDIDTGHGKPYQSSFAD